MIFSNNSRFNSFILICSISTTLGTIETYETLETLGTNTQTTVIFPIWW